MAETRLKTSFAPTCHPERLAIPLHWRRPRNVAVSFMGDLWHPDIPFEFIAAVFGVMAACPHHRFIVCTKRTGRARMFFMWLEFEQHPQCKSIAHARMALTGDAAKKKLSEWPSRRAQGWPFPNVVFLFSAETQARFDGRVADALAVPAVVHGVSLEPLLGPVRLSMLGTSFGLQWVIVGCESGSHRRPMLDRWARDIRDQCLDANVPFYLKQAEGVSCRVEKLPMLDGRQWTERPEVML